MPNQDFAGSDSFTYTAADGIATSAETTVSIQVQRVNDAPVGVADMYATGINTPLAVSVAQGLLANDIDVDAGDTLTVVQLSSPSNGQLILESDGSFVYQPNAGFEGTDSFRYVVSDLFRQSEPTTVTIVVSDES